MNFKKKLAEKIALKYGTIKRARGCFLYTEKRVRLTDLCQENGRAVLGWGAKGTFTILKNVLDRGITGSFLTDFSVKNARYKSRLSRAVTELFAGDRTAFVFSSKAAALKAALLVSPEKTSFFRPWNPAEIDFRMVDCIVFAPALPWTDNIFVLAVKTGLVGGGLESQTVDFEAESELPSPVCAAVTRSVYDLIKALKERGEKDWFVYDKVLAKYWTRKGPYLFPKVPEEKYWDFALHCLEHAVVVSPDFKEPSIVPFGADSGVFRSLEKNPFSF